MKNRSVLGNLSVIKMPTIKILPEERSIQVPNGTCLLQASLMVGIEIPQACGGRASCTTCRVLVKKGLESLSSLQWAEREILMESGLLDDHRLACQVKVFGDIVIERPVWPLLSGSDPETDKETHRE